MPFARTARQELKAAEAEFAAHCRANYEAPGQVLAEDAATLERITGIVLKGGRLNNSVLAPEARGVEGYPEGERAPA